MIEIGARGKGWFLCRAFGTGRREIDMLNNVRLGWSVVTGYGGRVGGSGAGFRFGCGVLDVRWAYDDVA